VPGRAIPTPAQGCRESSKRTHPLAVIYRASSPMLCCSHRIIAQPCHRSITMHPQPADWVTSGPWYVSIGPHPTFLDRPVRSLASSPNHATDLGVGYDASHPVLHTTAERQAPSHWCCPACTGRHSWPRCSRRTFPITPIRAWLLIEPPCIGVSQIN